MRGHAAINDRCPWCGRFRPADANGFYDTLSGKNPDDDRDGTVYSFCDEEHAERYHQRHGKRWERAS